MCIVSSVFLFFFFFNDTATTEIYTLSLHDALPIFRPTLTPSASCSEQCSWTRPTSSRLPAPWTSKTSRWRSTNERSEEHTSELQSRQYLVCRLLLEKKKKKEHTLIKTIYKKLYNR